MIQQFNEGVLYYNDGNIKSKGFFKNTRSMDCKKIIELLDDSGNSINFDCPED